MKHYIFIVSSLAILVAALLIVFHIQSDTNKQSRLKLFAQYESEGKVAIAQSILWDLIRDFPEDPIIQDQIKKVDDEIESEKQATALRWQAVDENFDILKSRIHVTEQNGRILGQKVTVFKANVEDFQEQERQYWVGQTKAQDKSVATDYLYQLLRKKATEGERLTADEIKGHLENATQAILDNNYKKAKSESELILHSEPVSTQAAILWSFATVSLSPESIENTKQILPVMQYIINTLPNNFWALQTVGMIYQSTGSISLAEEYYRKAYELNTDSIELNQKYVLTLVSLKKYDIALPIARKIWNSNEKSEQTGLLVWQCMINESGSEKISFLNQWSSANSSSALPDIYLGELLYKSGEKDSAFIYYQSAEKKLPSKLIYQKLATLSLELGKNALAIKYLNLVISQINLKTEAGYTDYLKIGAELIQIEFDTGLYSNVINDAEFYLKMNPAANQISWYLAKSFENLKDYKSATTIYESLIKTNDFEQSIGDLLELYYSQKMYNEVVSTGKKYVDMISENSLKSKISDLIDRGSELLRGKNK